jgi:hypothetical protein
MATKSLVIRVEIDAARKAHNCQANRRHRLERGHTRLKVRNGRSWDHYCAPCSAAILTRDLAKLRRLLNEIQPSVRGGVSTETVATRLPAGATPEADLFESG